MMVQRFPGSAIPASSAPHDDVLHFRGIPRDLRSIRTAVTAHARDPARESLVGH